MKRRGVRENSRARVAPRTRRFAGPMSEARTPSRGTDENAPDPLPSHATRLGVDGDGDTHWYSRYAGHLWVVGEDGVMKFDGGLDALSEWVHYVDAKHGWVELHWADGDVVATLSAGVEVGR